MKGAVNKLFRLFLYCNAIVFAMTIPQELILQEQACTIGTELSKKVICRSVTLETMSKIGQNFVQPPEVIAFINSSLESLNKTHFNNSFFNEVQSLDLSWCMIKFMAPKTFENLKFLTYLSLENNNITTIQADVFEGLKNLKALFLSKNLILGELTYNNITGLENLHYLDLSNNKILSIQNDTLSKFTDLQYIYLKHNLIKDLNFYTNTQFEEEIDLSYNQIQIMPKSNKSKLKRLYLQYNNISELNNDIFSKYSKLEYLNLSHNYITFLGNKLFKGLQKLRILNISSNTISFIDKMTFNELINLEILTIDHNKLKITALQLFTNLPKLYELHIHDNQFSCIPNNLQTLSNITVDISFCPKNTVYEYELNTIASSNTNTINTDLQLLDNTITFQNIFSIENFTNNPTIGEKVPGKTNNLLLYATYVVITTILICIMSYVIYRRKRRNRLPVMVLSDIDSLQDF